MLTNLAEIPWQGFDGMLNRTKLLELLVYRLRRNRIAHRVIFVLLRCPCERYFIPIHFKTFSIAAFHIEINNVSCESLVHTQGQGSHSSCNLYASENTVTVCPQSDRGPHFLKLIYVDIEHLHQNILGLSAFNQGRLNHKWL